MSGWGVEGRKEGRNASLLRRARERLDDVQPEGDDLWVITGNEKLGDKYPSYTVRRASPGRFVCSCQSHTGGQYRKVCSHVLAVKVFLSRQPAPAQEEQQPQSARPSRHAEQEPEHSPPLGLLPPPPDHSWGSVALPDWVKEFRPHQERAVDEIVSAFERGAKVVFLDAPTGSGKTLIGELVRRKLGKPTLYVCNTKSLQEQFAEDFPYTRVLKGRSNYEPTYGKGVYTCDDCSGPSCGLCPSHELCPYQMAKTAAVASPLATVNTAYLLAEGNSAGRIVKGRGLIIIDEADLLENSLMSHVEVAVSERAQKRYGIPKPTKKTVEQSWVDWVHRVKPIVSTWLMRLPDETDDPQVLRQRRYLANLSTNLSVMGQDMEQEHPWVYTGYDRGQVEFKPVKVDHLAKKYLWDLSERFLLMSASIISAAQMAEDLGLEPHEWELVTVESTFPPENRPVYLAPMGEVTRKKQDQTMPKLIEAVAAILDLHADERVLIHTVSYQLANELTSQLSRYRNRIVTYTQARDRDGALAKFKAKPNGVLVASSMDRGIDLPDDLCRVQVIAKVPFPNLADKQVSARLYSKGGQQWYQVQTVRTLVQMTGRAVRHKDDHAITYVLDSSFIRLFQQAKGLFPDWWSEALDWTGDTKRRLLGRRTA